jgi:hypothetical protein
MPESDASTNTTERFNGHEFETVTEFDGDRIVECNACLVRELVEDADDPKDHLELMTPECHIEWLRSHDAQRVFGVSWLREGAPSSKYLFEKFGFEELAHIQEYYYQNEEPRRWCPDCGESCDCDAKIYERTL